MNKKPKLFHPWYPPGLTNRDGFLAIDPGCFSTHMQLKDSALMAATMWAVEQGAISLDTYETLCFRALVTNDITHLSNEVFFVLHKDAGCPYYEAFREEFPALSTPVPSVAPVFNLDGWIPIGQAVLWVLERAFGDKDIPYGAIHPQIANKARVLTTVAGTLPAGVLRLAGRRFQLRGGMYAPTRVPGLLDPILPYSASARLQIIEATMRRGRYPSMQELGYQYLGNAGNNLWLSKAYVEEFFRVTN